MNACRIAPVFCAVLVGFSVAACGPGTDVTTIERLIRVADGVTLRRMTPEEVTRQSETAWGRAGDFVLENARVRFVISAGVENKGYVGLAGGVLDALVADAPGKTFDSLDEYWPIINGAPIEPELIEFPEPTEPGMLELRFSGPQRIVPIVFALADAQPEAIPVRASVSYRLRREARALEVVSDVWNESSEAVHVEVADFPIFGNDSGEMLTLPPGFDHFSPLTQVDGIGSAGVIEDWTALIYAQEPLRLVRGSSVNDQLNSGITGVVRYDVWTGELVPGESVSVSRFLSVGRDLSDAMGDYWRLHGHETAEVLGRVSAGATTVPWAQVSFFEDAELTRLATQARTNRHGGFSAELPPGSYFARASGRGTGAHVHVPGLEHRAAEGYAAHPPQTIEVPGRALEVELGLSDAGRTTLDVLDHQGKPVGAKLTFQREIPLPEPLQASGERQPLRDLGVTRVHWTVGGEVPLSLEPGTYTIVASRGPRYEAIFERGVQVDEQGSRRRLRFEPQIGPAGYLSFDSHLHGADSGHGEVSRAERIITALAEGLDIAISTDHDTITDYAPVARELGIEEQISTITGLELTYTTHHRNYWPLRADPERANGGAERWWFDDPGIDALDATYKGLGAMVIQLNHAGVYFRDWGYDPATGQAGASRAFNWGFNAMELHNGRGSGGRGALIPIWFSLLNWGRRIAPLAVSDSHARMTPAGWGRTYVWMGNDTHPSAEAVARGVLELRTVASTGPLIDFSLSDGSPALGRDITLAERDSLPVRIQVWAPSWIPIDAVRVFANGTVIDSWSPDSNPPIAPSRDVPGLWFDHQLDLNPTSDTWYVVEVNGGGDLAPIAPRMSTWAITAPLFVDADAAAGFVAPCQAAAPCGG